MTAALHPQFRDLVEYPMARGGRKQVVLFLGEASGEVKLEPGELREYRWASAQEAKNLLHSEYIRILDRVSTILED